MSEPTDRMTTFKRADGEMISDYTWVTDMDYFDEDWEPTEVIEERWVLAERRVFWHLPRHLYGCAVDWCDENATGWVQQQGGDWGQFCAVHGAEIAAENPPVARWVKRLTEATRPSRVVYVEPGATVEESNARMIDAAVENFTPPELRRTQ